VIRVEAIPTSVLQIVEWELAFSASFWIGGIKIQILTNWQNDKHYSQIAT
jgi:hypothetical protein